MNQSTPAIVTRAAARRLPRWALLVLCAAYLLPGFIGREAWKSADMSALGFMAELAQGTSGWLSPTLLGNPGEHPSLLPYWLGALFIRWSPEWIALDFAARLPFIALFGMGMAATWYATYQLAVDPKAQPVAFAFGGEAAPKDYARAIADGGLLALIACLGLAQLSHETTPALAQTSFAALTFCGLAALNLKNVPGLWAAATGIFGLVLCGAPTMAVLYGLGGLAIHLFELPAQHRNIKPEAKNNTTMALLVVVASAITGAFALNLWQWKVELPGANWAQWNGFAQLLIWFTWPAWPLALWTLWRWRRQLFSRNFSRHIALPLWFVGVTVIATLASSASDRTLMLALPAMASLAAFALPTLKRQMAALIDWFTLLFFSFCGLTIWVVWISMQTGVPPQPAMNVARLAPGFETRFSTIAFVFAVAATLIWAWLVQWRVGRHRAAIWKSLVLPAGGAALCWLLLMTLWMPLLNYTQSYNAMVKHALEQLDPPGCVEVLGLGNSKIAAFEIYGNLSLKPAQTPAVCPWLFAEPTSEMAAPAGVNTAFWVLHTSIRHPADGNESVLIFKRR